MKYYLAPLEGITTYQFRQLYHRYFTPMDKYFTPFLVPHTKRAFNARERREILPENNRGQYLVPQILTNDAAGFLQTAAKLGEYGYREVNLNLGCPSKTVVHKHRGAGFLAEPEALDDFLAAIFAAPGLNISVKTRLGLTSAAEFERLLTIFNRYPLTELIIHPRTQQDSYQGGLHCEAYAAALAAARFPVCFNGDITSAAGAARIAERFPATAALMLGRGIVADPGLLTQIKTGRATELKTVERFVDELYESYREYIGGERQVLFKMKEVFSYLGTLFPGREKTLKQLKKAESEYAYRAAVAELFAR